MRQNLRYNNQSYMDENSEFSPQKFDNRQASLLNLSQSIKKLSVKACVNEQPESRQVFKNMGNMRSFSSVGIEKANITTHHPYKPQKIKTYDYEEKVNPQMYLSNGDSSKIPFQGQTFNRDTVVIRHHYNNTNSISEPNYVKSRHSRYQSAHQGQNDARNISMEYLQQTSHHKEINPTRIYNVPPQPKKLYEQTQTNRNWGPNNKTFDETMDAVYTPVKKEEEPKKNHRRMSSAIKGVDYSIINNDIPCKINYEEPTPPSVNVTNLNTCQQSVLNHVIKQLTNQKKEAEPAIGQTSFDFGQNRSSSMKRVSICENPNIRPSRNQHWRSGSILSNGSRKSILSNKKFHITGDILNADMFDVTLDSKPSVVSKKTVSNVTKTKKLSTSKSRQQASMTRLSQSKKNTIQKAPSAAVKTQQKNRNSNISTSQRPPTALKRKNSTVSKQKIVSNLPSQYSKR